MKVEIPDSMVYFGAGVMVDRVFKSIFGNGIKHTMYALSNTQRLKEIENRRVVDVCGDTLGFFDAKGNIIKGELNE